MTTVPRDARPTLSRRRAEHETTRATGKPPRAPDDQPAIPSLCFIPVYGWPPASNSANWPCIVIIDPHLCFENRCARVLRARNTGTKPKSLLLWVQPPSFTYAKTTLLLHNQLQPPSNDDIARPRPNPLASASARNLSTLRSSASRNHLNTHPPANPLLIRSLRNS